MNSATDLMSRCCQKGIKRGEIFKWSAEQLLYVCRRACVCRCALVARKGTSAYCAEQRVVNSVDKLGVDSWVVYGVKRSIRLSLGKEGAGERRGKQQNIKMLSHHKTVMTSVETLTEPKKVFSQQAFCWELDSGLCVCVYVFYLEGSIDFYEGVEGGQVELSDLPPVTWLDGTLHVLPGNTNTRKCLKHKSGLAHNIVFVLNSLEQQKWTGFGFLDISDDRLITVVTFLGPSSGTGD